jgi:hypothetical protein
MHREAQRGSPRNQPVRVGLARAQPQSLPPATRPFDASDAGPPSMTRCSRHNRGKAEPPRSRPSILTPRTELAISARSLTRHNLAARNPNPLPIWSAQRTRFQLRRPSDSEVGVCCKPELGGTVGMRWTQTRPRAKRRMLAHRSRTRAGLPTRPPLHKTAKPKGIDRIGIRKADTRNNRCATSSQPARPPQRVPALVANGKPSDRTNERTHQIRADPRRLPRPRARKRKRAQRQPARPPRYNHRGGSRQREVDP